MDVVHVFLSESSLGIMIGIAGIILSFYFYLKSKRRVTPSVQFSRMTVISPKSDTLPDDVEILYKGNNIKQLSKTKVTFWNDGPETLYGAAVVSEDPVQICFGEDVTILRSQIIKETQDHNKVQLRAVPDKQNVITVEFDYLDSKDGVTIEILHDSSSSPIITGTIRGVPSGIRVVNITPPRVSFVNVFSFFKLLPVPVRKFLDCCLFLFVMGVLIVVGALFIGVAGYLVMLQLELEGIDNSGKIAQCLVMGFIYLSMPVGYYVFARKRYPKTLGE